ncbi:hypothetical protein B0J12DRAFT_705658 [Macrophomina phaseolina]|uniref:Uncharacterized protein n=1 Tax=Macrophomina phaseolina TaxID=35725 RepID=A0ABQ8FU81_9PEZI|nr:hypothetical protein B0J12DRAFT_705658 [Macrophomina phaseolina]
MESHVPSQLPEQSTEVHEVSDLLSDGGQLQNTELQMWKDYAMRLNAAYCQDRSAVVQLQHQWEQAYAAQMQLKAELENEQLAHSRTKERLDEERLEHGTILEDLMWQRHRLRESQDDTNAICEVLRRCRQIMDTSLFGLTGMHGRPSNRGGGDPPVENSEAIPKRGADGPDKSITEANSTLESRNQELESIVAAKDAEVAEIKKQLNRIKHKKDGHNIRDHRSVRGRRGGRKRESTKKQQA